MSLMPMYRRWQFMALEKNPLNFEQVLNTINDPAAFSQRDGGDGWTISEVLGHLKDFDSFFHERARAIAASDQPPPPQPGSPDDMVKAAGYAEQDALELLARWKQERAAHVAFLLSLPAEGDFWAEQTPFDAGGTFSLDNQVILAAYHDVDHLHQIVKIIRGHLS